MGIPAKHLKQMIDISCEPLMNIWNIEILQNKLFPTKLKFADISLIFKQFENIIVKNYRHVSLLPKSLKELCRSKSMLVGIYHLISADKEKDISVNIMHFWQ